MKKSFLSSTNLIVLILALVINTKMNAQWVYQKSPVRSTFHSVFFSSPEIGWAVGNNGAIIHTKDGGSNWENQSIDSTIMFLNSVYFISDSVGWIVGSKGSVYSTKDGGLNWVKHDINAGNDQLSSVYFITESKGFITGYSGDLYSTKDSGKTWTNKEVSSSLGITAVFFVNQSIGYIIGNSIDYYKTTNGGETWNFVGSLSSIMHEKFDHYYINENIGFVVGKGSSGNILKTTDGGNTWKGSGIGWNTFKSVHFPNPKYGWAVGNDGIVAHTSDSGENWKIQKPTNTFLQSVFFTSENHGIAVGDYGFIMKYSNTTSLHESEKDNNNFIIYPNPAHDFITVEANSTSINYEYIIYDNFGKKVLNGKILSGKSNINISKLPNGIYHIQLLNKSNSKIETKKIVICQ